MRRLLIMPAVATLLSIACPRHPTAAQRARPYGSVQFGFDDGHHFGISRDDTFPELPLDVLPRPVRDSAAAWVARTSDEPRCARYAAAAELYVAIVTACEPREDGQAAAAWTRDGRPYETPLIGRAVQ